MRLRSLPCFGQRRGIPELNRQFLDKLNMATAGELTSGEYIQHHLTNLTFGPMADGWGIAHSAEDVAEMGFWAMHLDSMFWSFALGALFCWFFARMAKRAR